MLLTHILSITLVSFTAGLFILGKSLHDRYINFGVFMGIMHLILRIAQTEVPEWALTYTAMISLMFIAAGLVLFVWSVWRVHRELTAREKELEELIDDLLGRFTDEEEI